MRKIVLWANVSLDGYIEAPDHDISWHRVDDELHSYFNDLTRQLGKHLYGRVTWELMAGYWPAAGEDPETPPVMAEYAALWLETPKIVYSRTLQEAGWGTTLVREVVPAEVQALKEQPGGDIALGGPDLADTFIRHGLVDEYRVFVHSVVIGAGTPLFKPGASVDLELVETRRFGNGVVELRYRSA